MIPVWKPKKLTFLIIPEANRQVRRYQIPFVGMYAAAIAVTVALTAATALIVFREAALQEYAQWKTVAERHERTVAAKDEQIAELQEEIVRLSQEAEAFAVKMEELQALERQLQSLTGGGAAAGKTTASAADEAGTTTASAANGRDTTNKANGAALEAGGPKSSDAARGEGPAVGGEFVPLDPVDSLDMSEAARASLRQLSDEADRLESALHAALEEAEKVAYLRSITPSIYPTISTQVTSSFGYRKDPFTRKSAYHRGIDFGGDVGDPIFATAAGSVSRTGYDRAMGNYVFVKHGNGYETVYMHLQKALVKKGQNVKKGEKIGTLGSTGRSTGPHLHYEVHKNGEAVNPKPYIQETKG